MAETDLERLQRLSADSILREVVHVEVLFHDHWIRFDVSPIELQHLTPAVLWDRYVARALADLDVPGMWTADPVAMSSPV